MMSVLLIVAVALVAVAATASEVSNDIVESLDPHNLMKMTSKDVDLLDQLTVADIFPVPKSNLSIGNICKEDVLLAKGTYVFNPSRNKIHSKDILIEGKSTIGITAIRVTELGVPQNGKVFVKEGGVGKNYVVIRMQSATGRGYKLETKVWGVQVNNTA